MKVLPFAIPSDRTIVVQDEKLPDSTSFLHKHEEVQLTWIREGEGTLIVGNSMHRFKPGEIYLFGANMPHFFKIDPKYYELESSKSIYATSIFFNPSGNLGPLFELPEMKNLLSFFNNFRNGFRIPSTDLNEIGNTLSAVMKNEGVGKLVYFIELLRKISLIREMETLAVEEKFTKVTCESEGTRISNIHSYIVKNFNKPITLEDVAEQACMTPHAFCRYFKRHTHQTLVSYINKIRVNEACKLLIQGSFNGIPAIAYSCGFNSITNFNRVFKSVTGYSPRTYIEQYVN